MSLLFLVKNNNLAQYYVPCQIMIDALKQYKAFSLRHCTPETRIYGTA